MKVLSVVGARPQFVKLAPFCRAIEKNNANGNAAIDHCIVHTGQHYDNDMSGIFFTEMKIPEPDVNLGVGSGSHGHQTGELLKGLENIMQSESPDVVAIFGDTNSTIAAALAAAKLHIAIAHVEAGLRSRDRRMPEEINRIVSDHVATLNLAPTRKAMDNLAQEGLSGTSILTGDIMLDAVRQHSEIASSRAHYANYDLTPGEYGVVTIHRAENTTPEVLPGLLEGLVELATQGLPLIAPVHPRTANVISDLGAKAPAHENLRLVEPVGYLDMINLLGNARLAVTDSGGLQREAFFMNVPCVTVRDTTEWPETIDGGANFLVGTDREALCKAVEHWLEHTDEKKMDFTAAVEAEFGDGNAGQKILDAISDINFNQPVSASKT